MDFEEFWKQFLIECQEHIEVIERHLLNAETNAVEKSSISELFRAFHSIKGLSKSMDLKGIESLAHVCEDILGVIREEKANFNPEIVDLLLRGLDAIRSMIEEACTIQQNIEPDENLLNELKAMRDVLISTDTCITKPAPLKTTVVDVKAQAEDMSVEAKKTDSHHSVDDAISHASVLEELDSPDSVVVSYDDETVQYFLEAIGYQMQDLIKKDPLADQTDIQWTVNMMRRSYNMMGFFDFIFSLDGVLLNLHKGLPDYWVNLYKVIDDAKKIQLNNGLLLLANHPDIFQASEIKIILSIIELIKTSLSNLILQEELKYPIKQIQTLVLDFGFLINQNHHEIPVQYFLDLDMFVGSLPFENITEDKDETLKNIILFWADISEKISSLSKIDDSIISLFAQHHNYLSASNKNSSLTWTEIQEDEQLSFIETIDVELLSDLQKRFKEGGLETCYVVSTYLEEDQSIGETFAMFATKNFEMPFNRSLFIDKKTWYELLIIYTKPEAELEQALRNIDPAKKYLMINQDQTTVLRDLIHQGINHLKADELIKEQTKTSVLHEEMMPSAASSTEKTLDPSEANTPTPAEAKKTVSATSTSAASAASAETIRVPGDVLDKFMNDIGEMVLACSHLNFTINSHSFKTNLLALNSYMKKLQNQYQIPKDELSSFNNILQELDTSHKAISENNSSIHSILRYLQESALNLRVIPLETVFKRLPRIVRDVSKQLGKKINLVLEGQEVRIDKSMVDCLVDPLIHMLRNSIDHGIETPDIRLQNGKDETGTICISAVQQGNQIRIDIQDDGYGLDPEKLLKKAVSKQLIAPDAVLSMEEIHHLIFHPGFSTAAIVTEVSGRGVGMDVVRSNVSKVGGHIAVTSQKGKGTKISLKMPLSAAIQEVLIVNAAQQTFAIPSRFVTEIIEFDISQVMTLKGQPSVLLRNNFLPISYLAFLLGFGQPKASDKVTIVVLHDGQSTLGVHVDEVVNRSELYMKDVHQGIVNLPGVGGASILGNGRVVLVLDGEDLLNLATKRPATRYENLIDIERTKEVFKNNSNVISLEKKIHTSYSTVNHLHGEQS
ncbi:MAG: hypothetical protein C0432_04310 [Candidatus Puniceispirillum sp.]|nr:hypothetical protein [Candidatus Pelagibacter sp.]MBA4283499.1 hypothetical protein [Candidatus Puniceispirillum sp.]